jgi:acyl homoserine lactone synthase
MFYLARRYSAKSLVALGEVKQERLLALLGVRTRRYGPPQPFHVGEAQGSISIVAGETPIANQRGHRFEALLKLIDDVEIQDETHVLGSDRLSA